MTTGGDTVLTFKEQIFADNLLFLNTDEFANIHTLILEGTTYQVAAILDQNVTEKYANSFDEVYKNMHLLIFNTADVRRPPINRQLVILDGKDYLVVKSDEEMGMATILLAEPEV